MQLRLFDAGDERDSLGSATLREAYLKFVRPVKCASQATLGCDLSAINWFEKQVGDLPLRQIGTREISLWRSRWAETGLTHQTWNKHVRHIKAIFRELYDQELINRVPRFKSLPEQDPLVRIASGAELQSLLAACHAARWPRHAATYWRSLLIAGVSTGLRRRDLLGLRRADVNYHTRTLTYRARKTGKLRTIPISCECVQALQAQGQHAQGEFLWYSTSSPHQWYREWGRIKRAAGVGELDFHNLRSTCGSRVYQQAGLAAASEMLAHSSLAVTRRHYISTSVASESLRTVVDSLQVETRILEIEFQ